MNSIKMINYLVIITGMFGFILLRVVGVQAFSTSELTVSFFYPPGHHLRIKLCRLIPQIWLLNRQSTELIKLEKKITLYK